MEKSIKATFQPEGRSVYVLPGTTVFEAAAEAGITIDSPCGGKGTCGKCRVIILEGNSNPTRSEMELIEKKDIEKGVRLACQTRINSPIVVEVPYSSRFSAQRILVSDKFCRGEREIKPGIRKMYMELTEPTLKNQTSLLALIREKAGAFEVDIPLVRKLPDLLKESGFKITCVFSNNELIAIEKGNTTRKNYGIAIDLGTTTIVGTLLDLSTGIDIDVCARMNPQVLYGDDVISRINYAMSNERGLEELHTKIIEAINGIVGKLAESGKVDRDNIYNMSVAGNSTMQHIFLNISPGSLGVIPFVPVLREGVEIKAQDAGIEINPQGRIFVFPNIAGFVGGDTVAVILAANLYEAEKISLAIDIGTNGEIVLGNRKRIICASAAAGPAFEGARISQGMRATAGAIEKVVFNDEVELNVIDNLPPKGICGSGLIDAIAEMIKAGIIDETGRILSKSEIPENVPRGIAERIIESNSGNSFLLVNNSRPVFITQKDVRELQLAKAAIFAGVRILEKEMGIEDKDIEEILLAGAFGNFIRRENAMEIGLIPHIPLEKIKFIGNAASSGAKIALLSGNQRLKAEQIARFCEYVELSNSPDFQEEFANAMLFKG